MIRAAFALLLLAPVPALAQEGLAVEDAYAIATVPGGAFGSAYMAIRNPGEADDRLLSATSPDAESVELHQSVEEDGVMRMEPAEEGLPVPAGGALLLERGGAHLMFVGLSDPWEDGDAVELTLVFEEAGPLTVSVPVDLSRLTGRAPAAQGDDAAHGADHGADHADDMDHGDHGG